MASKKRRRDRRQQRSWFRNITRGPWLIVLIVVVAIGAIGGLIAVSQISSGGGAIERIEGINVEGRTRGPADAPVTIIEFGDYQCPNCKRFAENAENDIEREYIAQGLVRFEFRNMAFIGPESVYAAEAAQCANDQGKFWDYHDKLYQQQGGENSGNFSYNRLKGFAGDLGLDQASFDQCLDSGKYEQMVLDETNAGNDAGVQSTPWFFINGEVVKGAQAFSVFQQVIETKLQEAPASS